MKHKKSFVLAIMAAAISLVFQMVALAQAPNDSKIANVVAAGGNIRWDILVSHSGGTLTISFPDGRAFRKAFRAGTSPEINLSEKQLEGLPDGVYGYELQLVPTLTGAQKDALMKARGDDDDPEGERAMRKRPPVPQLSQSGSFWVLGGTIIGPGAVEGQRTNAKSPLRQVPTSFSANTVMRLHNHRLSLRALPDDVIPDDLIVQGSACIGLDCVNNESFGFDTIRMKENNTRVKFDDTSTSPGFPANDWQLTANDSASGGASKFSIEDVTGSKVPFTITAGAATNSIFVDSTGRLGLRTSSPILDVHVDTSNTPAMRFEQNNSGGFTAQTWDVAGNEANFFVRDVTGGSRLPFRIRPGAPTSSIDIGSTGNVGISNASPQGTLHSKGQFLLFDDSAGNISGGMYANILATTPFTMWSGGGDLRFGTGVTNRTTGAGFVEHIRIVNSNGRVGINTSTPDQTFSVNGDASKMGGGSWQSFSDERLKNIKGNFNRGLSAVLRLQPLRYEYKPDNVLGLKSEGQHVGFAAQAVQQIIPEAVSKNGDGYLMVNNDPIIWTMLNAIKEQQKEIADLKAEVQKLKSAAHRRRR